MKIDKQKNVKTPDLRHGVEGSVLVNDTNENFAGRSPSTTESGPASSALASVCQPQARQLMNRKRLPTLSEAIRIEGAMEVV